jgi:membrane protein
MLSLLDILRLTEVAVTNWQQDRVPRMGAALAYYIALSLAPTALILLALANLIFGAAAAEGRLVYQIQGLVGHEGANAIQTMMGVARRPSSGIAATSLGLITVFFAASAVVSELKDSMNVIWRVPEAMASFTVRRIWKVVTERLAAAALVLLGGAFLLTSVLVNAWIFAAGQYLSSGAPPKAAIRSVDWLVSFVAITVLFAFIFKVLPSVPLHWSDVGFGAVATSLLFVVGKFLLGMYLGRAAFADSYGAAGSLVIVLVWVYYSAQVLFFGAELTRAYAVRFGSMQNIASRA